MSSVTSKNVHAGDTLFIEKMLIEDKEDLRAYKYLWEAKSPYPAYDETSQRINLIGLVAENSGTLLVSPDQFEKYCKPVIAEYAKYYKEEGKYLFLHACGHLKGLLKQIAEIDGLSGIESLTPPLTADTDLEFARKTLRKDMTIIGGMDPVSFLNSTPDEIEEIVKGIIKKITPGNNFILMTADSTPENVPVGNFNIVSETIDK